MKAASGLLVSVLTLIPVVTNADAGNADHPNDSHYTESGFFDIHVCNWPDREPFYLALYSTRQFKHLKSVELMNVRGEKFASLNLSKFMIVKADNKPEKRVFMTQIPRPKNDSDGWFSARITLNNNIVHKAKNRVKQGVLPKAQNLLPAQGSDLIDMPKVLRWSAVEGALYYQVYIKDKWGKDELIFTSNLLTEPELMIPEGIFEHGGLYSWRVHARDVNEDIELGDFNMGSLSSWQEFSIVD